MKKYVKNKNSEMYKENEFELKKSLKASSEIAKEKKQPTSIALDPKTIEQLKILAEKKGIPYQVLMRMFIVDGYQRMKKTGT